MKKNILAAVSAVALIATPAFAADKAPQGRPGIIRLGDKCHKPTGDLEGSEVPCDDQYAEAEKIASFRVAFEANSQKRYGRRESRMAGMAQRKARTVTPTLDQYLAAKEHEYVDAD